MTNPRPKPAITIPRAPLARQLAEAEAIKAEIIRLQRALNRQAYRNGSVLPKSPTGT